MTETVHFVEVQGVAHRAYSARELAGLAEVVASMPMPAGEQPDRLILGSHTPSGDVQFGVLLWLHEELEWRFVPAHLTAPDGTEEAWPAHDEHDWPINADPDQRWRA